MFESKPLFSVENYQFSDGIGNLMARVRLSFTKAVDEALQVHNISHTQGIILMLLHSGQYNTAADLARCLNIDAAGMKRTLDRLEARSLVARADCALDKRQMNLHLLPDGIELATLIPSIHVAVLNQHFTGFCGAEIDFLKHLLQKMLTNSATDIIA